MRDVTWDTDRSTTVGDTGGELRDVAGLMTSSETEVIVSTVDGNVLNMTLRQFLNSRLDGVQATLLAHRLRRVVGVAASTVPVARKGLGVEGNLNTPLFRDANEEVASYPEVVAHRDALTGADLEFPLGRHHFCVDTGDVDTRVEAGPVVRLDEITREDLART